MLVVSKVSPESYQLKSKVHWAYRQAHSPLVPIVQARTVRLFARDFNAWPTARWALPLIVHLSALANTFLLGTLFFSLRDHFVQLRKPRIKARYRYGLQAWADQRASYPFRHSEHATPLEGRAKAEVLRLQALLDNPATALKSITDERNKCLLHLEAHGGDSLLQLTLGEATLAIADRSALEVDRAAQALGWRWVEEAYKNQVRAPRLWAAILRWGHDRPALVLEAEENARKIPQLNGLLLQHQVRRKSGQADTADLEALQALSNDDPQMLAYQAAILVKLGRRQEALELRWRLMRLKPLAMGVWRILVHAYDQQERELLLKLADGPTSIIGPEDQDWLLGPASFRLGWGLGGLLTLTLLLFLAMPSFRFWAEHQLKGAWKPVTLSVLETVALVRPDGSRIPWEPGYPPWIASYDRQETQDFSDFTASSSGFTLTLNEDGAAEIGPAAPPEFHSYGYRMTPMFNPLPGNAEAAFKTKWIHDKRVTRVLDSKGGTYLYLQGQEDGILATFMGRNMALLLRPKGSPARPLKWDDWRKQPVLIRGNKSHWLIHRAGSVTHQPHAQLGTSYGYNRSASNRGGYETPEGEFVHQSTSHIEWLSWSGDSPPSSAWLFP
jgi:tetratricopeptide (TPR) repeat protein